MRKLLLTSVAVIGAAVGFAGAAQAQAPAAAPVFTYPITPESPNSFKVHLDGRLNWYAGVVGTSVDTGPVFNAEGQNVGNNKLTNYDFQGYIRLYPGFDAVAANGLKYGVSAEIRMPGAGGGLAGPTPGATSGGETLFWRRAYGYVGTDQLGTFRFGMGDSVQTLFQTGTFEGFNDGAWNGDAPGFVPGNAAPSFPWADTGTLYTSNKIVYLSPKFGGFQFGAGFAPNTENLWNDSGCASGTAAGAGGVTCNRLTSQAVSGNLPRPKNTADIGIIYTDTFGGFGINTSLTYIGSGHVTSTVPDAVQYQNYSVGAAGLELSYAGFTVGGHITGGQLNGDYSLMPQGGVQGLAWMVGGQYTTGPIVIGASYFQYQFAGNWTRANSALGVGRTETDDGFAAGGTYTVAPGMALYLSYLYGQRHQIGYDFVTGTAGSPDSNNAHSNVFSLGTVLKW
jgi:Gram-negative porin